MGPNLGWTPRSYVAFNLLPILTEQSQCFHKAFVLLIGPTSLATSTSRVRFSVTWAQQTTFTSLILAHLCLYVCRICWAFYEAKSTSRLFGGVQVRLWWLSVCFWGTYFIWNMFLLDFSWSLFRSQTKNALNGALMQNSYVNIRFSTITRIYY